MEVHGRSEFFDPWPVLPLNRFQLSHLRRLLSASRSAMPQLRFAFLLPYRPPLLALLFDVSPEYRMHQLHRCMSSKFWIRASLRNTTEKVSDVDLSVIELKLTWAPLVLILCNQLPSSPTPPTTALGPHFAIRRHSLKSFLCLYGEHA